MTVVFALASFAALAPGCAAPEGAPTGRGDTADTGRPEDTAPVVVGGGLLEGEVMACEHPELRATPIFDPPPGSFGSTQPAATAEDPSGWGASVADFDGDGFFDLVLPQHDVPQLFRGDGTGRLDLVEGAFPTDTPAFAYGASGVDYDGDGDLDVYLTRPGRDGLFVNDGAGRFTDRAAEAGLADEAYDSVHASWGDYDGDGDLDVFVANYWTEALHADPPAEGFAGDPNALWENDGAGGFVDRSALLGWRDASYAMTFMGAFWDVDGDRRPELQVVNDKGYNGYANTLAKWDGGGFADVVAGTGLDVVGRSMGVSAADLNDDQVPDFLVSDWGELWLLVSDGAGGWYDAAFARGLDLPLNDNRVVAWGSELEDLDNDGDIDLFVAFGNDNLLAPTSNEDGVQSQLRQFDGVWLQGDDGHFTLHPEWRLGAAGCGRGSVLADLDGNGWLDFVRRDIVGTTKVNMQACGSEGWLQVALSAPAPNTRGIGARVEVEAGGRRWTRWIHAGSSNLASSGPPEAHVGLGDVDTIDTLRVIWPDGGVSEFHDVAARQRVTVWRE